MPAIYFSLGNVQPFADMKAERPEEGVTIVTGDGKVVGLRLDDPRQVLDLPGIIERHGLDADRVWNRLRADDDVMLGARAATWGAAGRRAQAPARSIRIARGSPSMTCSSWWIPANGAPWEMLTCVASVSAAISAR